MPQRSLIRQSKNMIEWLCVVRTAVCGVACVAPARYRLPLLLRSFVVVRFGTTMLPSCGLLLFTVNLCPAINAIVAEDVKFYYCTELVGWLLIQRRREREREGADEQQKDATEAQKTM